ncbi:MAG: hypothetical protein Q9160_008416 [Pyrenula sp. 1 TL-2023]
MDIPFITSIAGKVKSTFKDADEEGKRRITDALREIQYSVEPPEETMQRILHQNLTIAMIRVALDLKVYDILIASKEPVPLQALADQTGTDLILLGRIMRHQSSMCMVEETSKDTFAASNLTHNLAIPEIQSGIYFCNDVLGPVFQSIPAFLKETDYQNPTDGLNTVFQFSRKTELPMWTWLHQHPTETSHFNNFMRAQRMSTPNCFSFFNLGELCKTWPTDQPVFLDVGGGTGHQCIAVKEKFPKLSGQIILQDLSAPISEANLPDGAKFYYLRAIFHDHNDEMSLKILQNLCDAMGPESVLLLDEIVLPNTKVDWYATQTDLSMMTQFASIERTQNAWIELLDRANMEIRKETTYTYVFRLTLMEVVKKTN